MFRCQHIEQSKIEHSMLTIAQHNCNEIIGGRMKMNWLGGLYCLFSNKIIHYFCCCCIWCDERVKMSNFNEANENDGVKEMQIYTKTRNRQLVSKLHCSYFHSTFQFYRMPSEAWCIQSKNGNVQYNY